MKFGPIMLLPWLQHDTRELRQLQEQHNVQYFRADMSFGPLERSKVMRAMERVAYVPSPAERERGREWHLGDTPSPPAEGASPPLHSPRASFGIVSWYTTVLGEAAGRKVQETLRSPAGRTLPPAQTGPLSFKGGCRTP